MADADPSQIPVGRRPAGIAVFVLCFAWLVACGGKRPGDLGVSEAGLAPCPSSPNCVSSTAADESHRVDGLALAMAPAQAWPVIRQEVLSLPGTSVLEDTGSYLRAECASSLLRFVDDLELQLRVAERTVEVRSASRLGRSDLGVNRRRVERLREALRMRGVVR